jgi:hypothetical protein
MMKTKKIPKFHSRFSTNSFIFLLLVFFSCQEANKSSLSQSLFQLTKENGIDFRNSIIDTGDFSMYHHDFVYNGGGVGCGDFNNDGLSDIFFVGNQVGCKLYLNKGDFQFEDITIKAGLDSISGFPTGVTLADVDGNGFLDIYVIKSGFNLTPNHKNTLFLNNGALGFKDVTDSLGLGDNGTGTHATFFDYDNDNDLDLYVVNYTSEFENSFDIYYYLTAIKDSLESDKLFENVNGIFKDVTRAAGIGYQNADGLSAMINDYNNDGFQDIFVANDLFQPDFLYLNNGDKTFTECGREKMKINSFLSMGSDAGDVNNDGISDIVVCDMAAASHARRKNNNPIGGELGVYQFVLNKLFSSSQSIRNTLHLGNPDGTFSEVGESFNMAKTDWSWSPLLNDLDNDGYQDLFITNGVKRDVFDQTYLMLAFDGKEPHEFKYSHNADNLQDSVPRVIFPNVAYKSTGNLSFEDVTVQWGFNHKIATQGAAFADLNNDGFLDLILNNSDSLSFVYRNDGKKLTSNSSLTISFVGPDKNTFGIGAKVYAYVNGNLHYRENQPSRGFQSCTEPKVHLGLGSNISAADSVVVIWPGNKQEKIYNIKTDSSITVHYVNALPLESKTKKEKSYFQRYDNIVQPHFIHAESSFSDFERDRLIPNMYSRLGPEITVQDFNGDSISDFFITGTTEMPCALFIQNNLGTFEERLGPWNDFTADYSSVASFDADGDGDLDLYLASGSNEFLLGSSQLADRLLLNDGDGTFLDESNRIPYFLDANSCVRAADFDNDGDLDLFVGGGIVPGRYPEPPSSRILRNDHGVLLDVTSQICAEIMNIGMVNDASWTDINQDGFMDLVIVGEWLPITVFKGDGKSLTRLTPEGLLKSNGWWNCIKPVDIDSDGDIDFVAGNYGKNSILKASREEPVSLLWGDFDKDGTIDPIVMCYLEGIKAPLVEWERFCTKMPTFFNRFLTPKQYGETTAKDLFTESELMEAQEYFAYQMSSSIIVNDGGFNFRLVELPAQAQFSTVNDLVFKDLNSDNLPDIILAGNSFSHIYDQGPLMASRGLVLQNKGDLLFEPLDITSSGINVFKEAKSMAWVTRSGYGPVLIIGCNNDSLITYVLKKE